MNEDWLNELSGVAKRALDALTDSIIVDDFTGQRNLWEICSLWHTMPLFLAMLLKAHIVTATASNADAGQRLLDKYVVGHADDLLQVGCPRTAQCQGCQD